MNVNLKLNSGQGSSLGPNFNLTASTGVVTPSTATLTQLLAGKLVAVDSLATYITVTSIGDCTNSLNITITA